MTRQDIYVNIRGMQTAEDDENAMELFTEGVLTHEGDCFTIEYDESEMSGLDSTKTLLTVEGERIHLRREGDTSSDFIFLKDRLYETAYETPLGVMQMSVLPIQIASDVSEEKGNIDLEYVIRIGEHQAVNRLSICYKARN